MIRQTSHSEENGKNQTINYQLVFGFNNRFTCEWRLNLDTENTNSINQYYLWLIILAIKVGLNKILLSKTLWDLMRIVVKLCNLETPGNLI